MLNHKKMTMNDHKIILLGRIKENCEVSNILDIIIMLIMLVIDILV